VVREVPFAVGGDEALHLGVVGGEGAEGDAEGGAETLGPEGVALRREAVDTHRVVERLDDEMDRVHQGAVEVEEDRGESHAER